MSSGSAVGGGPARSASVSFSASVHKIDSIKKAAYRFSGLASVDISPDADSFVCRINFLQPQSDEDAGRIVNDFKIEVLDQDLREQIAHETAAVRNAVLAYAFSKTGLQASE